MMFSSPVTQHGVYTLMVMAGGTGGHIYPAMAVADALKVKGWRIVWLVTESGMENRLIEGKGYQKAMISMRGVRGKGLLGWLLLPIKLAKAFWQCLKAIRQYKPDVLLGMGGFAAFPGGVMGKLAGKPLVIHEQNSIAGLTNKTLSLLTNRVLTGFPQVLAPRGKQVGNPVRAVFHHLPQPKERYASHQGALRVLVVGGSLGAAALNNVLPKALTLLPVDVRPKIIHQAGEKHIEELRANYRAAGVEVEARAFIHDMAEVYQWADVVICRAGALTVAEIACVGVASVLVPFPYAVDDHQTTNAKFLADAGAAVLIQQTALTVEKAAEVLRNLSRDKCLEMAQKARALAKPEATEAVANICMECALLGA